MLGRRPDRKHETMARLTIRYLTQQPGPAGGLPRYFWQPSRSLRRLGWRPQRVPADWSRYQEAEALHAAAIARAEQLNAELDRTRTTAAVITAVPPPNAARTVGELIADYRQHERFLRLAPTTQRGYRQCLDRIQEWAGDAPVRAIDEARVQRLKLSLRKTPAVANAVVRVLRLLLEHGRRSSWITHNPALRPALDGSDPSGIIWPRAAVDAFVAAADAAGRHSIGTAVLLNYWLGQRQADILRMTWSVYRNGQLILRQRKTNAAVSLPVDMVQELTTRLAAERERIEARHAALQAKGSKAPEPVNIIVSEETHTGYRPDNFRHLFATIRAAAAAPPASTPKAKRLTFEIDYLLPGRDMTDPDAFKVSMDDLTFMHLRHTAVTALAERGATAEQISSVSGHAMATVNEILERYMVRTAALARGAFQLRLDGEIGQSDPPHERAENTKV